MNILIDAHVFDGEYQGSRTYIKEIYSKAIIQNSHINYYFAASNVERLKKIFPQGNNVHYVKLKCKNKYFRLLVEFPVIIKSNKIDYAHFQYICPIIKNTKWIVSIHDILFIDNKKYFPVKYRVIRRILFAISAMRADIITTISRYSLESISKHFNIPSGDIILATCGVGELYLEARDKAKAKEYVKERYGLEKYIIYVSRIEPRKNHHSLLTAFLELELDKIGYNIVFVGEESISNDLYNNILNGAQKKRIESSLVRLSNVSDEELKNLLLATKIAVYPSLAEGFGIPPLESAVMEVPTICSNMTSMEDFQFFGINHIVPSVENIKHAISAIIDGKQEIDYKAIRNKIINTYKWEMSSKILIGALKKNNRNQCNNINNE